MPMYDYEHCERRWEAYHGIDERHSEVCPKCGKKAKLRIVGCRISSFKPFWNEHLDPAGPIWIKSQRHYKEELNKRGMICEAIS